MTVGPATKPSCRRFTARVPAGWVSAFAYLRTRTRHRRLRRSPSDTLLVSVPGDGDARGRSSVRTRDGTGHASPASRRPGPSAWRRHAAPTRSARRPRTTVLSAHTMTNGGSCRGELRLRKSPARRTVKGHGVHRRQPQRRALDAGESGIPGSGWVVRPRTPASRSLGWQNTDASGKLLDRRSARGQLSRRAVLHPVVGEAGLLPLRAPRSARST